MKFLQGIYFQRLLSNCYTEKLNAGANLLLLHIVEQQVNLIALVQEN